MHGQGAAGPHGRRAANVEPAAETAGTAFGHPHVIASIGTHVEELTPNTSRRELVCTSTTGVSPVTVTLSAILADAHVDVDRGGEIRLQHDAWARTMVENPVNVNVAV